MDMTLIVVVVLSYLAGSVPFAFLLARRRGIDLRSAGSGNVGASNVFRTTGKLAGVIAALLDVVKGAAVVMLLQRLQVDPSVRAAAGVAAVVGHIYPVWLRFNGGKGVATTCGVFAVLAPAATGGLAVLFAALLGASRYVSVASMGVATLLGPATYVAGAHITVVRAGFLAGALVVYRHRSNLVRLQAGTERRVGQRA